MPEDFLQKWKMYTKKEWKIAFVTGIIIGMLTHMFVFTNILPNHDSLISIYHSQGKSTSGRFFLTYFAGISSYFALPWINGVLSILYLSLTAVVLTEFFELRKSTSIILTSGLIVTFPTVGATFSYMFTADAYMAAILLATLAVLMTKKYKFGFILGALFLYLSVGIYQANLTIVLTIVSVWFIQVLILNQMQLKKIIVDVLKYISMTAIGMGLYWITFKSYQEYFGGSITDYQGLNQVGQSNNSISETLVLIKETIIEFFFRGFVTDSQINLFEILNTLIAVIIIIEIVLLIFLKKVYLSPIRIVLMLGSIYLLPIFSHILYFVSPGVIYHMLMIWSTVLFYLLPIILYEGFKPQNMTVNVVSWIAVITLFLVIFNFSIISNITYLNMSYRFEKSFALVNRIFDRIEQTEGYENIERVAFIGKPEIKSAFSNNIVAEAIPPMTGAMGDTFLPQSYHFNAMFANYIGKSLGGVNPEELQILKENPKVKQMGIWPAKDSVLVLDEIVFIKFK